ncbi:MAG: hypothetical protein MUP98_01390, partial [Candidatus Aminicenantes bacterium]|nr:hypothetical protein [Candidatus Aminicenantes bacterium]
WVNLYTKDFRNNRIRFTSAYDAGEWQQFSLSVTLGENYGSQFQMFGISKKLKITDKLFSEYDLSHVRYFTDSQKNRTFIHVLKLTMDMSENLSLKILFQKNTIIDKTNYHVVCTYAFKPPFGTIQLIYQKGTAEFGVRGTQGHTFFLKLGYMF